VERVDTVSKSATMQVTKSRRDRDTELRCAHRRAFDKISHALSSHDYRTVVSEAVSELVDACEAYIEPR
jgi:hypothetical protein